MWSSDAFRSKCLPAIEEVRSEVLRGLRSFVLYVESFLSVPCDSLSLSSDFILTSYFEFYFYCCCYLLYTDTRPASAEADLDCLFIGCIV